MESQGQIQDFLNVLRQRRWQILLPALFLLTLGVALAVIVPKKYLVVTRIELRESQLGEEAATEREVFSAEYHIKHFGRVRGVIEEQAELWPSYFELAPGDRADFVRDVMDRIEVLPLAKAKDRGSTFVDISYSDVNPERAERFLSQLTSLWIDEVVQRDLNAVGKELEILRGKLQDASRTWGEKKSQYHELARELGIDPTQPVDPRFQNRGDLVTRRLEARVEERDAAHVELSGMVGELEKLQELLGVEPPTILNEVDESNPWEVELLRIQGEISTKELEQARFKKANSQYAVLQREIDDLRREQADTEVLRDQSKGLEAAEENPEYTRLETAISEAQAAIQNKRATISALDVEIAELGDQQIARSRDFETLGRLSNEIDLAWEEVDEMKQARDEKALKLQVMQDAYGRPFDIAQEPEASEEPTEPNPALIVAAALLVGLVLGLGSAVVSEFARNGFRGVHDLRSVMDVPVLGAVNAIVTRAEARRARARRTLVGLSSAILLGSVLWVTWTWYSTPDLLPIPVFDAIEGFRKMLL